jgi:hypothetical protein
LIALRDFARHDPGVQLPRRLAILFAVVPLAACSPPSIDITIRTEGDHRIAEMSQDWGIFSGKKLPCIGEASLYRGSADTGIVVWKIRTVGEVQCLDMKSLVIGQVPKGFEQVIPLPAAPRGQHILQVRGIGGGDAALTL